MTQQERIAAALTRAGVSTSPSWAHDSAVALEIPGKPESSSLIPGVDEQHLTHSSNPLVWCGLAISVASLCLFLIAR